MNLPCRRWQNFKLVQIESFRDTKISVTEKLKFIFERMENIVRKCWLPAFSPFPTMISKALCFKVVKSPDCVVKSSTRLKPNTV